MRFSVISIIAMMLALVNVFVFTPIEASQGLVQKIFYIHVASALTMYCGFFIAFISGIFYLIERKTFWDQLCVSAVEVGFVFCSVVLSTGPLWAKPVWGVWWTWDPRLTTTFLLWLIYAGFILARSYVENDAFKAKLSSIIAIVAFIDVPLIHYSVKLWRGVHPSVISNKDGLPTSMKTTLILTFFATILIFITLFKARLNQLKMEQKLKTLNLKEG